MAFFNSGGYSAYELLALPHSILRVRSKGEYSSACPKCGGYDRFRFWPDLGNYWCRRCGLRGFVDDAPQAKRTSLRELMNSKITTATSEFYKWLEYHSLLLDTPEALAYWKSALGPRYMKAVDFFGLGYCSDYKGLGPTVTIPLGYAGRVYAVKHRILGKNSTGGKYTNEPSGLGAFLFNVDSVLDQPKIVMTEGEKKAMRLWLEGYPTVGSSGDSFPKEWKIFIDGKVVYLITDPDEAGEVFARKMVKRYSVISIRLPDKVDDWINSGGDISAYLGKPWMEV